MNAIVLAFTLKGQEFSKIKAAIEAALPKDVICIHGFMSREDIVKKKFSTEVVDFIESYFPIRINFYTDGQPRRAAMCEAAHKLKAKVFVIGDIKDGVAEELGLYRDRNIEITHIKIRD